MSQKFYEGGNRLNYITGGTIFFFNRIVDETTTPISYRGNRDWGNVKMAPSTLEKEDKPHYSARSGTKIEDDMLSTITAEVFTVTFDEWCAENAWNYFRGATLTDVGASTNGQRTETVQLTGTEVAWLSEYAPSSIVVKSFDLVTTHTVTTDYVEVTHQLGYKGIKLPATPVGIANNAVVSVTYTYKVRAHKSIAPFTAEKVEGEATFFGVSRSRGEFIRPYKRVRLDFDGSLDIKPDDWSDFQIKVTVLDSSSQYPSAPWGLFQYYGLGKKIYDGSIA